MIYLASQSPRRAELLQQLGIEFIPCDSSIDETPFVDETPENMVKRLSQAKARCCLDQLPQVADDDLVIASDTCIGFHGEILGKPASAGDCQNMLGKLSGNSHQVYSAVSVVNGQGISRSRVNVTEVRFRDILQQELIDYCSSDEPLDKAGSYAIQGKAAVFIEHISGSYSAVMGLPLFETAWLLRQAGQPVRFGEHEN